MMENAMAMSRRALARGLVGLGAAGLVTACSTTEDSRADLDARARVALAALEAEVPPSRDVAERSPGYLIFPGVTQGSFGFGGQFGRGVLYKGGQPAGFYSVTGGSFGFQAGAQTFSQGYFFTTEQALRNFEALPSFQLGAGVGVDFVVATVGTRGELSTATLQRPLIVFVWGQSGLSAGINVAGQTISRLAERS
jgi:lipid-binding SYLF domain-containing protein